MNIVIDENIPAAREAFGQFGELRVMPGRAIDAAVVRDADILLVRSVTRVDAKLLAGSSRLRFVGSTTAGVDHVDPSLLEACGISFASAPGSNADSVVDYVLATLALAFPEPGALGDCRVGIIGCGEVGGRLLRRLRALGIGCRVYDPFVEDIDEAASFGEVRDCDVVTLHVPLTTDGEEPTARMFDAKRLSLLREDVLLINTARGPVVDNAALLDVLGARPHMHAVLDVWNPEPELDPRLLAHCMLGTAHIAGYALDGKLRGVEQVYEALSAFLGHGAPASAIDGLHLPPAGMLRDDFTDWQEAVLACYDPSVDDARLRAAVVSNPDARGAGFDRLRRDYPVRREFSAWQIPPASPIREQLLAAGFGA